MYCRNRSILRILPVIISAFVLFGGSALAQEQPDFYVGPDGERVYNLADKAPEFPGGTAALLQHISENVKYPAEAREAGVQGRVIASFVVNKTGDITRTEILEGLGSGTDEEVIRVLENMPQWTPGEVGGKPVNVKMTIPFVFKLDGEKKAP